MLRRRLRIQTVLSENCCNCTDTDYSNGLVTLQAIRISKLFLTTHLKLVGFSFSWVAETLWSILWSTYNVIFSWYNVFRVPAALADPGEVVGGVDTSGMSR